MGLENFSSDAGSSESDTEQKENDTEQESTHDSEQNEDEETTSDEFNSGLGNFKTDSSSSSSDDETEDSAKRSEGNGLPPWVDDLGPHGWNQMSTEEKVRYVRENYDRSYRPEIDLDGEWDHRLVVEIECQCGNIFTFRNSGTCFQCQRQYGFEMGDVFIKHDPQHGSDQ